MDYTENRNGTLIITCPDCNPETGESCEHISLTAPANSGTNPDNLLATMHFHISQAFFCRFEPKQLRNQLLACADAGRVLLGALPCNPSYRPTSETQALDAATVCDLHENLSFVRFEWDEYPHLAANYLNWVVATCEKLAN